eukprot:5069423-Prymnesium_polylepis.2
MQPLSLPRRPLVGTPPCRLDLAAVLFSARAPAGIARRHATTTQFYQWTLPAGFSRDEKRRNSNTLPARRAISLRFFGLSLDLHRDLGGETTRGR